MANADIRQLEMDGKVFYPQTDLNALINNGAYAIDEEPTQGSSNLVTSDSVYRIKSETLLENREMVDSVMLDYAPVEIHGDVTNAADEEDLTSVNVEGSDVLKFKDKVYNQLVYSGMGKKILRKNMVNGVNTLTQNMINDENTIYVIQYDYVLGENITVPANCILEFDGGSISASSGENMDTITGNNTGINAGLVKIFNTNIILAETWNNTEWYPEWFGAKGDGVTDDTNAIQLLNGKTIKLNDKTYLTGPLEFNQFTSIIGNNKFKSCLKQKDNTNGDYLRLVDWSSGRLENIRVEGGIGITGDDYFQALIKVVVHNYRHPVVAPSEGEPDESEVSTYYSVINNIIIRNSERSGLTVQGQGTSDRGFTCGYNWVHNFSHIHIAGCQEWGIVAQGSDNLWSEINVGGCGYANILTYGYCEMWNNLKLDGESGWASREEGETSLDVLRKGTKGALLCLVNAKNSCFLNVDLQSCKYSGIKMANVSCCNIVGSINNIGLAYQNNDTDQKNTPAFYLESNCYNNYVNLNIFQHNSQFGLSTKYPFSYDKRWPQTFKYNTFLLIYKYLGSYEDYKTSLDDAKALATNNDNVLICPNLGLPLSVPSGFLPTNQSQIQNLLSDNIGILYFDNVFKIAKINDWSNLESSGKVAEALLIKDSSKTIVLSLTTSISGLYLSSNSSAYSDNVCCVNTGDAVNDIDGNTNSKIALQKQDFSEQGTAFDYCNSFSTTHIPSGQWYVPSLGELIIIYKYKDALNYVLQKITGAMTLSEWVFVTSTQNNKSGNFYTFDTRNGSISVAKTNVKNVVRPLGCVRTQNSFLTFGDSTNRPSPAYDIELCVGTQYFDTTLGKPIWWNGTAWVDTTGTPV